MDVIKESGKLIGETQYPRYRGNDSGFLGSNIIVVVAPVPASHPPPKLKQRLRERGVFSISLKARKMLLVCRDGMGSFQKPNEPERKAKTHVSKYEVSLLTTWAARVWRVLRELTRHEIRRGK